MQRRDFLKSGALAGGAALVGGCGERPSPQPEPAAEATAGVTPWQEPAFEHAEATIADLAKSQADGKLTARALAEAYLARIEAIDRSGPRGPLHGIPVLLKDNIDTADRMRTSAGSLALAESVAPRDAFVAERLRAAGAVPRRRRAITCSPTTPLSSTATHCVARASGSCAECSAATRT